MYWNDVNATDLAVYTNGTPFNCLMPYKRPDAAKMDLCEAAGVRVRTLELKILVLNNLNAILFFLLSVYW